MVRRWVTLARHSFYPPERWQMNLNGVKGFHQVVHRRTVGSTLYCPSPCRVIVHKEKDPAVVKFILPLPSNKDHRQELNLANELVSYDPLP